MTSRAHLVARGNVAKNGRTYRSANDARWVAAASPLNSTKPTVARRPHVDHVPGGSVRLARDAPRAPWGAIGDDPTRAPYAALDPQDQAQTKTRDNVTV